jgi:lysophospholipase L1-like esterase
LNDSKVIDIVPENCWIIEKKSCLAQGILPVVTKDHLYLDDHPDLTNEQFNQQKIAIEKFIRPNWTHPNSLGHQIIAETIIKKLKKLK